MIDWENRIKVYQDDSRQQRADIPWKRNTAVIGIAIGLAGVFLQASGMHNPLPVAKSIIGWGGIAVASLGALGVDASIKNIQRNDKHIAQCRKALAREKRNGPKI
tara:strand:+ start:814 stop:1128 length:315 start_codon:yes stop_codon:yes gene_type:complete